MSSGMAYCAGCGIPLCFNPILKAARDVGVIPVSNAASGCGMVGFHIYPHSGMKFPVVHVVFETSGGGASGVLAAIKDQVRRGKLPAGKYYPLVLSGDGASADIGIGSISGMMARGEEVFYVCNDNGFYANTGCQYSSMTPEGAHTTTTPQAFLPTSDYEGKDMIAFALAHPAVRYIAHTTVSGKWPDHIREKARLGFTAGGPAYMHVIQPCPRGWGYPASKILQVADAGIETGVIPLYSIVREGDRYVHEHKLFLDYLPERYEGGVLHPEKHPVIEWFETQARFKVSRKNEEWIVNMQRQVDHKWLGKHGLIARAEPYGS